MSDPVQGNAAPQSAPDASPAPELQSQESEVLESQGEEGSEETAPAETKAVEKRLKKLKLKVDGEEIEEEFNLDDDEYLTRQLQLAKMAQKRGQSYSQLEKEIKSLMQELKSNPRAVLESDLFGLDMKQLAASIIEEEIERAQKSPEQLEKEALQKELADIKAKQEQDREEERARNMERLHEQEVERYDMLFTKALEGAQLPKSPYVVKKMADYMLLALDQAEKIGKSIDITPEDVLPLVVEEMKSDLQQMFAVMPEELIEQYVGRDTFDRVRKKNLQKAKAQVKPKVMPKSGEESSPKTEDKSLDYKKFFGF